MAASPQFRRQITIGGTVYELRPNFACYCAIEDKAKESLMKVVMRFSKGELLIRDIAAVVWGGMVGTAEELNTAVPMSFETMAESLVKEGWAKHSQSIIELAGRCVMGYGEAVSEQAAEEKSTKKKPTTGTA
jgi:hypothetical protein